MGTALLVAALTLSKSTLITIAIGGLVVAGLWFAAGKLPITTTDTIDQGNITLAEVDRCQAIIDAYESHHAARQRTNDATKDT